MVAIRYNAAREFSLQAVLKQTISLKLHKKLLLNVIHTCNINNASGSRSRFQIIGQRNI